MSSDVPQSSRYWSWSGIVFMAVGLAMVFYELQTGHMQQRLGWGGQIMMIGCGAAFSIWGLKEVIVGRWPRFARRGYTFHLPREGALYLVICCVLFVGSLIGRSNTLLMVFSLMASLWIMNGWFTFTMLKRLSVQRELPRRVMAGEPFTVSLTLQNRKLLLSVWLMVVEDVILQGKAMLKPHVVFVRVPPRGSRRGHYQVVLAERGRYQLGPVAVKTRFPLGLVERGQGLAVQSEVLVYPRVGRLRPNWKRRLLHAPELVSHLKPLPGPFNDEMHRIRAYRVGDDPRMIHWPTTARMSELMVREFRESRDRDLLLIVDAWLSDGKEEAREEMERGLRLAATICVEQLRGSRESSLSVRLAGEAVQDWHGGRGQDSLERLLDLLALVEPVSRREVATLWSGLEVGDRRRCVVVTPRPQAVARYLGNGMGGEGGAWASAGDVQILGTSIAETSDVFEEA